MNKFRNNRKCTFNKELFRRVIRKFCLNGNEWLLRLF